MLQIVNKFRLLQRKNILSPLTSAGNREFKGLAGNQEPIQLHLKETTNIGIRANYCQYRFASESKTSTSSDMKRLQGKVAVVTASTDGLENDLKLI